MSVYDKIPEKKERSATGNWKEKKKKTFHMNYYG
jgi:hypothetical protein